MYYTVRGRASQAKRAENVMTFGRAVFEIRDLETY